MKELEQARCERIRDILVKENLDGVLISNISNMRYLSGFSGGTGYLLITNREAVIFTDSRYTIQAKEESTTFTVVELKDTYVGHIMEWIEKEQIKILGFEGQDVKVSDYLEWKEKFAVEELRDVGTKIALLRSIKTPEELEKLEEAERIGDKAFSKILEIIKPGMTELEVAAYLEFWMKQYGAEGLSFDTIAASGLNSAKPHAVPGRKVIEKGDFLTMDFGCVYEGYCSDMTRTIVVGKASMKQKEIYQIVLDAQLAALDFIQAGKKGWEVDKVARDRIVKAGYGEKFGHGLGHSVGLYIHEEPRLSKKEETILEENMVVTVEPGIYIENFGGVRIEDMVVVTKDGCKNLTHSSKEFLEIS